MENGIKAEFSVMNQLYSTQSHRNESAFYAERHGKIAQLPGKLVWLMGDYAKNFPLSMGAYSSVVGESGNVTIEGYQYEYPVIGRTYEANQVAETPGTLTAVVLGVGYNEFALKFKTNQFKRNNLIYSTNGTMAIVCDDPTYNGSSYTYKLRLVSVSKDDSCPVTEVVAGTPWSSLFTPVSFEKRESAPTNIAYPGKVRNQVTAISQSMSFGAKANNDRVMNFTFSNGQVTTSNWMSYFMWQFEKDWMEQCEHLYWYSRYNRDFTTGEVTTKHPFTGEAIQMGSGVLEQIQNYDTYSTLTYAKLENIMSNAFYGLSDSDDMRVTLHTGTGGMRMFDAAVRTRGIVPLTGVQLIQASEKFITGSGYNMGTTGFFSQAYLIDGYFIEVKKNRVFDIGRVANAAPRHPLYPNMSRESFRMVFIDDANIDGEKNINYITVKGEEGMTHAISLGMTDAPKDLMAAKNIGSISDANAPLRNPGYNEGSYRRDMISGIQIKRPNRCIHLENV